MRGKKPEEEHIWEKKMCLILGLGCLFFKKRKNDPFPVVSVTRELLCLSGTLHLLVVGNCLIENGTLPDDPRKAAFIHYGGLARLFIY